MTLFLNTSPILILRLLVQTPGFTKRCFGPNIVCMIPHSQTSFPIRLSSNKARIIHILGTFFFLFLLPLDSYASLKLLPTIFPTLLFHFVHTSPVSVYFSVQSSTFNYFHYITPSLSLNMLDRPQLVEWSVVGPNQLQELQLWGSQCRNERSEEWVRKWSGRKRANLEKGINPI